mgnify:CR=1 FL=1
MICFRAAVMLVISGMLWELYMAISGDHSAYLACPPETMPV